MNKNTADLLLAVTERGSRIAAFQSPIEYAAVDACGRKREHHEPGVVSAAFERGWLARAPGPSYVLTYRGRVALSRRYA